MEYTGVEIISMEVMHSDGARESKCAACVFVFVFAFKG